MGHKVLRTRFEMTQVQTNIMASEMSLTVDQLQCTCLNVRFDPAFIVKVCDPVGLSHHRQLQECFLFCDGIIDCFPPCHSCYRAFIKNGDKSEVYPKQKVHFHFLVNLFHLISHHKYIIPFAVNVFKDIEGIPSDKQYPVFNGTPLDNVSFTLSNYKISKELVLQLDNGSDNG